MPDPTDEQVATEPEGVADADALTGAPLDPDYLEQLTKEGD